MDVGAPRGVLRFFDELEDPRMDRTKRHSLQDILFLTVCAVLCGADCWTEVELFGRSKLEWLRQFIPLTNGIPSHDTLGRVFARLKPEQLECCFVKWTEALKESCRRRGISIDGKTLRRSFDKATGRSAVHMVSAWCETSRLVLGQLATEEKSNEITAIPKLLEMLELRDAVVTIDAMGCQKEIAKTIVENGGHYVLQVKANQPELHDLLKETFDDLIGGGIPGAKFDYHEDVNADHGRIETRRIWVTGWTDWYPRRREWAGLRSFTCVESVREVDGQTSIERRYYISDLLEPAQTLLGYIRGHWGIENRLHWCLDVAFREDTLRNRVGHSAENFSRIRRLALNLLKQDKTSKVGVKGRRLRASLDPNFLLKVLGQGEK